MAKVQSPMSKVSHHLATLDFGLVTLDGFYFTGVS
jgi:hypothetical protein